MFFRRPLPRVLPFYPWKLLIYILKTLSQKEFLNLPLLPIPLKKMLLDLKQTIILPRQRNLSYVTPS